MPEFSNIQTYEKLIGADYQPTLDRFRTVLQRIDLWNDEVKQAFDAFEWVIEADGFAYPSIPKVRNFKTKFSDIAVRPLVMVYPIVKDKTPPDYWMECNILVEAEKLRDFDTDDYYKTTYDFVKSLASEMHTEFKMTGVYFTDEVQDGHDFDGLTNSGKEIFWQFDYAIIPLTLEQTYSTPPLTHKIIRHDDYLEAWHIERWIEKGK